MYNISVLNTHTFDQLTHASYLLYSAIMVSVWPMLRCAYSICLLWMFPAAILVHPWCLLASGPIGLPFIEWPSVYFRPLEQLQRSPAVLDSSHFKLYFLLGISLIFRVMIVLIYIFIVSIIIGKYISDTLFSVFQYTWHAVLQKLARSWLPKVVTWVSDMPTLHNTNPHLGPRVIWAPSQCRIFTYISWCAVLFSATRRLICWLSDGT